jgi:hypothetical protein
MKRDRKTLPQHFQKKKPMDAKKLKMAKTPAEIAEAIYGVNITPKERDFINSGDSNIHSMERREIVMAKYFPERVYLDFTNRQWPTPVGLRRDSGSLNKIKNFILTCFPKKDSSTQTKHTAITQQSTRRYEAPPHSKSAP